MKLIVTLAIAILLILGIGCSNQDTQATHEQNVRTYINQTLKPAVALIYVGEGDNFSDKNFICTATAIAQTGNGYLFLTAAHCVIRNNGPMFLSTDANNPEIYYPAYIQGYGDLDKDQDFAILYVQANPGTFTTVKVGSNPAQDGEAVLSVSAPAGVGKATLRGTILMTYMNHDRPLNLNDGFHDNWQGDILFNTVGEAPGGSGSALICEDQMKICGIFVGMNSTSMIAIPIEKFEAWWIGIQRGEIGPYPQVPPVPIVQDKNGVNRVRK